MKKEIFTCDIMECDKTAMHKEFNLQVIFLTEQTEGRSCAPHLSNVKIDLCTHCMDQILDGHYIFAVGAQGHNTYKFRL